MTPLDDLDGLIAAAAVLGARSRELGLGPAFGARLATLAAQLADAGVHPAVRRAPADGDPARYGMVGASPAMGSLFGLLEKVIASEVPVLIQGETGTGKELVARALHEHGPRMGKPFVVVNCAAVAPNLLESELFGHKRGSFTGAVADREGHFAAADTGTLFLDEIGDMPLAMQAKLLRALQDGEVRPVGSNRARKVNVRVVAATHRDLVAACRAGDFREDLYFRLAVVTVALPPLRERAGDIPRLALALLPKIAREVGRAEPAITPEALAALDAWTWPGNVRELENELRRAVALAPGAIGLDALSSTVRGAGRSRPPRAFDAG